SGLKLKISVRINNDRADHIAYTQWRHRPAHDILKFRMDGDRERGTVMLSGQIGSHRRKYDRQVVLGLHVRNFDEVVDKSVRRLYDRAKGSGIPCDMVFWFECPDWTKRLQYKRQIFSSLTPRSRLYIVGHGNWKNKTIAGYDAKTVAILLAKAFQLKTVGL